MTDLLVAGGGPAGLATAIFASLAGMSVVVVEPHVGPIDKACGEGIMPAGRSMLQRMGVEAAGTRLRGVRYHQNGSTATGHFRDGEGVGIRRTELSDALWRRAAEVGVVRQQGRIRSVDSARQSVSAVGTRARWLVAADGLNSSIRRQAGIPLVRMPAGRYGLQRHFEGDGFDDFVDVYLGPGAEAYVTPVGGGLIGVAVLSAAPGSFEEELRQFPELTERLGAPAGRVRGAGPFSRFASRVSQGRIALVGDAAGFLDPITGEGIRLAFESAELLVDCLKRDRIEDYEFGWRRIVRRYRRITSLLLVLRRNRYLRGGIVPVLNTVPGLFDRMLNLLGGE